MKPTEPIPVKWFAGILYSEESLLEKAALLLSDSLGRIDFRSSPFDFAVSDYYQPEMGGDIRRLFISFEPLASPERLAEVKILSNGIEDRLAVEGKRKVNIDTGYLDYDKVVLASAKYNGDKIYLQKGIWADLTLRYEKGGFRPYPWSFPDFKTGTYHPVLLEIRSLYKLQCRKERLISKE